MSESLPAMPLYRLTISNFDLRASVTCGQSFCWRPASGGWWSGWIARQPVAVLQVGTVRGPGYLEVRGDGRSGDVADYFQLTLDLDAVVASFPSTPRDAPLHEAAAACRGLRIFRQDAWETLANFICSPQKQIVQIARINDALRRRFGREMAPGRFSFPEAETLAAAGTEGLLACKLGYRAKNLAATAQRLAGGALNLSEPDRLPTPQAREYLMRFPGVGEKVADCVLLFAYNKWDAFPVDVWVERALRELYFKRRRKPTPKQLRAFSRTHFGPYGGYAQQVLFHWIRTRRERGD